MLIQRSKGFGNFLKRTLFKSKSYWLRGKVISWPLLWPLRNTSAQLIFQDGRCTCTYVSKNLTCTVSHHIMQPGLDHVFSKIGSLVFYRNINRNKMLYFTYASSIYKFYWNLKKKANQMRGTMNLVYMHLQGLWKNCCGSKEDLLRINTFLLFGQIGSAYGSEPLPQPLSLLRVSSFSFSDRLSSLLASLAYIHLGQFILRGVWSFHFYGCVQICSNMLTCCIMKLYERPIFWRVNAFSHKWVKKTQFPFLYHAPNLPDRWQGEERAI